MDIWIIVLFPHKCERAASRKATCAVNMGSMEQDRSGVMTLVCSIIRVLNGNGRCQRPVAPLTCPCSMLGLNCIVVLPQQLLQVLTCQVEAPLSC